MTAFIRIAYRSVDEFRQRFGHTHTIIIGSVDELSDCHSGAVAEWIALGLIKINNRGEV